VETTTLKAALSQPNTHIRAFDPQAGFIASAGGEATYIVSDLLPFASGLRQELLAQAKVVHQNQRYTVYRLDAAATLIAQASSLTTANLVWWSPAVDFAVGDPEELRHDLTLPIVLRNAGGALAFMGYDLSASQVAPGDELTLTTYWQVIDEGPPATVVFAHLLDAQSTIWAGWDGLDVSPHGWQRDDIILQHIRLNVPVDAPLGEYQLEIGLYTAADGRRFVIFEDDQEVADRLLLQPVQVAR
jgi:hypothetical protein